MPCSNGRLVWNKTVKLEVLSGAKELRVIVCKVRNDAPRAGTAGTSVVAACGLYVKDVLQCVPIDKYFELFKPHQVR